MMNSFRYLFLFLPSLCSALGPQPELTKEFWNNPEFIKSFMGDYGFRTEIEPRVTKSEQNTLREVVAKAQNQIEEAIDFLESKLNEEASSALDFALATMYFQIGRLTPSAKTYEQAILKFPSFLRAHKNLGFVHLSLGNYDKAASSLAQAINLGEGDGVTFVALGYCHLNLENFVSAENAYRMGVLLLPDSEDARNGLVNCFLQTQRFQEAIALLDELLQKKPDDVFCHRARAAALQGQNREKDAVVALETLRRMGHLKLSDFIILGDLYHNLQLYDLSLTIYQEALSKKEKLSLKQYIRVAKILIGRRSYEDGFRYLDKIEKNFGSGYSEEDEKEIRLLQAEVMRATGKNDQAKKLLRVIVEKHPLEGSALIILAQLAWQEKNFVEAGLFFERAAQDSEYEVRALIDHGRMLVSINQYENAIGLLERAQIIEPRDTVASYLKSLNNLLLSSRIQF